MNNKTNKESWLLDFFPLNSEEDILFLFQIDLELIYCYIFLFSIKKTFLITKKFK